MIISFSPIAYSLGYFSLQWYGAMIALGASIAYYLLLKDPILKKIFTAEQFSNFASFIIIQAILGGRILWFIEQSSINNLSVKSIINFFALWQGGFSLLGSIIAVAITLPWYIKKNYKNHSFLKIIDRLALYSPLIQGISRIGCLFAGCCYGIHATSVWNVTYTHHSSLAPLFITLHPVQLYSSILLLMIFIALYSLQKKLKPAGALISYYLIAAGTERFLIDFLRADRTLIKWWFSTTQALACGLIITGLITWCYLLYDNNDRK